MKENKKYLNDDEIENVTGGVSQVNEVANAAAINAANELEARSNLTSSEIINANANVQSNLTIESLNAANEAAKSFESQAGEKNSSVNNPAGATKSPM